MWGQLAFCFLSFFKEFSRPDGEPSSGSVCGPGGLSGAPPWEGGRGPGRMEGLGQSWEGGRLGHLQASRFPGRSPPTEWPPDRGPWPLPPPAAGSLT